MKAAVHTPTVARSPRKKSASSKIFHCEIYLAPGRRRAQLRRVRTARGPAFLLFALLASCGARTPLEAPELLADAADVTDAAAPDTQPSRCIPGTFELTARAADVVFVIDRSGSMSSGLSSDRMAPRGLSRWELLRDALAATLPLFQLRLDVGALFYPTFVQADRGAYCAFEQAPRLDVSPATGSAAEVLSLFASTGPRGGTPTFAAMSSAYAWFTRHVSRARSRSLVLATDGGPNCNPGIDPTRCVCVGGAGPACRPQITGDTTQCLDDERTVRLLRDIATSPALPIPTYVVGIAPDVEPALSTTLTAMAIAGGRPKVLPDGTRTFYSVRQAGDLSTALTQIQQAITRCAFVTPSQPDSVDGLGLSIDGVVLPRDPSRLDGWDWTDRAYGEVTLFGPACERLTSASTRARVAAIVQCGVPDR